MDPKWYPVNKCTEFSEMYPPLACIMIGGSPKWIIIIDIGTLSGKNNLQWDTLNIVLVFIKFQ